MEHTIAALATPPARAALPWCVFQAKGPTRWRARCSTQGRRAAALQTQRAIRAMLGFLKKTARCATRWWPCASARLKATPAKMW